MDNLLQPICEAFPNYVIEKQSSPSYVRMFTKNATEDVVLVCVKSKQTTHTDSNRRSTNDNKEEFELTGSPLKLDMSLHTILDETLPTDEPQLWTKEEGLHLPVPLVQAREIANCYNSAIRKQETDTPLPMWILCSPTDEQTLLLMTKSYKDHFVRGVVKFEGTFLFEDINIDALIGEYAKQEMLSNDLIAVNIDCKYNLFGASYSGVARTAEELVNAPYGNSTELHCEWTGNTIQTPIITCKVILEQEIIVGHLASPCNSLWKSICALHRINQLLVDMTVAGSAAVNLETSLIRREIPGAKRPDNAKRLNGLLNEVESYAFTADYPAGGCVCVTDDTTTLRQCLDDMNAGRSSNDFVYCLWDILRDCETADELISLLVQALKFISSGKIRPFIDANNKSYLSKLVLKLSRGHSQGARVLKNLRADPPQALSLLGQVGVEKTLWEYTRAVCLVEHSFRVAGIWAADGRSQESVEQINQTIQDMTMGGDYTLNPFESLSNAAEHSIRLDCESFYDDDPHELSVDEFASLKKHGLVGDKKTTNEVPLIADEIDITPWKNLLTKFAQVHVCLEHLYRAEVCLRADFANLKPLAGRLLQHYVSDRSPVKTVGQLMNEPVQRIAMPIANNIVKDHLKKPVSWYRVELNRKENSSDVGLKRDAKVVCAFTQQPVFPPSVWQHFANLKPLAGRLLQHYVSDRSPVKTVGQLMNEPVQRIAMPIANNIVKDHLKKPVSWYRVELNRKENSSDVGLKRDAKVVCAFTQQPVFPPSVWQHFEPQTEHVAEITTVAEELKYHCTKFTLLSNRLPNKLPI